MDRIEGVMSRFSPGVPAAADAPRPRYRVGGLGSGVGRTVVPVLCALLVLFLALPLAALALHASPALLLSSLSQPTAVTALTLSLETTGITLLLILILGTPTAYALARRRFPGKRLVNTLIDLPIVMPPAVAGVALLLAFGREGALAPALGAVGVHLSFSTAAVVLAQFFVSCPFYVRTARAGFLGVDQVLEDASRTLGYGGWGTFRRVTVPLALPSLISGSVLSWARALGEFGATIMFAGNLTGVTQTMPLAVYLNLESGDLDGAVALSILLVVLSIFVLLLTRIICRD